MSGLIERLEKATGPDRELDCDVWHVVHPAAECIDDDFWQQIVATNIAGEGDIPTYTASIDAALTLVPEGYGWRLDTTNTMPELKSLGITSKTIASAIWSGGSLAEGQQKHVVHIAANPAIALCIAALKARHH